MTESKANNSKGTINASYGFLIDIYMKFSEDSLNGFQVIVLTRVLQTDRQSSKGNNSKSINVRVMVLVLCTSSNVD